MVHSEEIAFDQSSIKRLFKSLNVMSSVTRLDSYSFHRPPDICFIDGGNGVIADSASANIGIIRAAKAVIRDKATVEKELKELFTGILYSVSSEQFPGNKENKADENKNPKALENKALASYKIALDGFSGKLSQLQKSSLFFFFSDSLLSLFNPVSAELFSSSLFWRSFSRLLSEFFEKDAGGILREKIAASSFSDIYSYFCQLLRKLLELAMAISSASSLKPGSLLVLDGDLVAATNAEILAYKMLEKRAADNNIAVVGFSKSSSELAFGFSAPALFSAKIPFKRWYLDYDKFIALNSSISLDSVSSDSSAALSSSKLSASSRPISQGKSSDYLDSYDIGNTKDSSTDSCIKNSNIKDAFYETKSETKKGKMAFGKPFFTKLNANSSYVFKLSVLRKVLPVVDLTKLFSMLMLSSTDAAFLGYPYGLIRADSLARVTNNELQRHFTRLRLSLASADNSLSDSHGNSFGDYIFNGNKDNNGRNGKQSKKSSTRDAYRSLRESLRIALFRDSLRASDAHSILDSLSY